MAFSVESFGKKVPVPSVVHWPDVLPPLIDPFRNTFILATYIVVLFSVIGQGLTVKPLVQYFLRNDKK